MYILKTTLLAAIAAWSLAASTAQAEFSDKWNAAAAEMEAGCDTAERSAPAGGPRPAPAGPLKLPTRLSGPLRPHMCVIVTFSLDDNGAADDVSEVYRGPENLNYAFVRSTVSAVKKWRFDLAGEPVGAFAAMHARIDFIPLGNRRYSIRYNYWNGGAVASNTGDNS